MNFSKIFLALIFLLFLSQTVISAKMDRLDPITINSGDTWTTGNLDMFDCPDKLNINLLVGLLETDFTLAERDIDDDDAEYQCIDFFYNGQKILKIVPDTTLSDYYFTTYAWNGVYWYKLHEKVKVDSEEKYRRILEGSGVSSIAQELSLDVAAGYETATGIIGLGETDIRVTKIMANPAKLEELIRNAESKPGLVHDPSAAHPVNSFKLEVLSFDSAVAPGSSEFKFSAENIINLASHNAFIIGLKDLTELSNKQILDTSKYATFTKYGFSVPPISSTCSIQITKKGSDDNLIGVLGLDFSGSLDFQSLLNNCDFTKPQTLSAKALAEWKKSPGEYTLTISIDRVAGRALNVVTDFKVVVSNLAGAAGDQRDALAGNAADVEARGGSLNPPLKENPTAKIIVVGIGEVEDGQGKIFGVGKGQPLTFNVEVKQSLQGTRVDRFDWEFYSINADNSETPIALPASLTSKSPSARSSFDYNVPFEFSGVGIKIKLKVSDDAARTSNYSTVVLSVSPELTERVEGPAAVHTSKPGATDSEFFKVQLKATVEGEEFPADVLNESEVAFKKSPPFSLVISFLQSKHPTGHSIRFNLGKDASGSIPLTNIISTAAVVSLPEKGGVNLTPVNSAIWSIESSNPSSENKCISTPLSDGTDTLVRCEIPVSQLNGINVGDITTATEFEIWLFSYNAVSNLINPNSELRFTVKLNHDTSKTISFTDEIRPRGKGLLVIDPNLLDLVIASSAQVPVTVKTDYSELKTKSNLKVFKLSVPPQLKGRTSYLDYRVDSQDQIRNDRKAFLVAQGEPAMEIPLEQLIGSETDPNNPNLVKFSVPTSYPTGFTGPAFELQDIERNDESNPKYAREGPFYYVAVLRFPDLQPMHLIFSFEKGEKIYQP